MGLGDWLRGGGLERGVSKLDEGLSYYLGPAYQPIKGMGRLAGAMLPGADLVDMQQQGANLMASKSPGEALGNLGWLGASVAMGALPGTAGALREGVEEAAQGGIRAYHGSPHDFDRFSLDKIGTGEGAQAYGHGLYFAENEGVARSYRNQLSGGGTITVAGPDGKRLAFSAHNASGIADGLGLTGRSNYVAQYIVNEMRRGKDLDGAIAAARADYPHFSAEEVQAGVDALVAAMPDLNSPGHMYEVNIAANPEDFLDWDKPLSEQSEKVRGVAERITPEQAFFKPLRKKPAGEVVGRELWEAMRSPGAMRAMGRPTDGWSQGAPSEALRDAGIPGIRYLDAGSRPAQGWRILSPKESTSGKWVVGSPDGYNTQRFDNEADARAAYEKAFEGSRNYVVFDDSLISILRKYGLGGLMAGGAVGGGMGGLGGYMQGEEY